MSSERWAMSGDSPAAKRDSDIIFFKDVTLRSINDKPLLYILMTWYEQATLLSTHPANLHQAFGDSFCPSLQCREGAGMGKSKENASFGLLRRVEKQFPSYVISSITPRSPLTAPRPPL
ncbi:MAG: hypothetical protein EPO24_09065 [Bacteroidetes bacterium]|nr:MAG: hypothetical protein EPO24_09065 [Bacteroidota bacterium]